MKNKKDTERPGFEPGVTSLRTPQLISSQPLSTTQPPLQSPTHCNTGHRDLQQKFLFVSNEAPSLSSETRENHTALPHCGGKNQCGVNNYNYNSRIFHGRLLTMQGIATLTYSSSHDILKVENVIELQERRVLWQQEKSQ